MPDIITIIIISSRRAGATMEEAVMLLRIR
jgi:hypothetical protein